jgi:AraC-like DNA-binding protein
VYTSPAAELQHRTLLNASDPDVALEAVTALIDTLLAAPPPRPPAAARRRLVDGARETLAASPAATLTELADGLAVSPHHLSRVFRGHTGETVSRYRNRVRVRCALERIRDGEPSLARLAADLGFADHAHLTRAVVRETGAPPSRFRRRAV